MREPRMTKTNCWRCAVEFERNDGRNLCVDCRMPPEEAAKLPPISIGGGLPRTGVSWKVDAIREGDFDNEWRMYE